MPGVIRPPYGQPTGPTYTDRQAIERFVAGERTGHSPTFHVEERVLVADRFIPIAIRLGPGAVLVRGDVETHNLQELLPDIGYVLVSRDPDLAVPVAMQAVGLRDADWRFWCLDAEEGWRLLEIAAFDWA